MAVGAHVREYLNIDGKKRDGAQQTRIFGGRVVRLLNFLMMA